MSKFNSYYEYETTLAREVLIPFFTERRISLDEKRVLDVGCGEGGLLSSLSERFQLQGLGIDYDREMIAKCRPSKAISFQQADFFAYDFQNSFDFVLLRDVLEHSGDFSRMLQRTASILSDQGLAYITYTPYYSPFGGHQHNGTGVFANVPYLQFLPDSVFLRLIKPAGNVYKTNDFLLEDLKRIRQTRIATSKVVDVCRQNGFKLIFKKIHVIRPDYYYKFGLPRVALPKKFPLTTTLDPFCTSVEMIIKKQAH